MPPRGRTIVEAESYVRLKKGLGDPRLIDEVQQSFDLILANNPFYGDSLARGEKIRSFTTTPWPPRVPSFRILYRYDPSENPEEIELLALEPLPLE